MSRRRHGNYHQGLILEMSPQVAAWETSKKHVRARLREGITPSKVLQRAQSSNATEPLMRGLSGRAGGSLAVPEESIPCSSVPWQALVGCSGDCP